MPQPESPVIGILGGSGLYQIDGLEDVVWREVRTALIAAASLPVRAR